MIRVYDLEKALDFFVNKLGLVQTRKVDNEQGKFSLIFLATASGEPEIELTHNWDQQEPYGTGRNFGHLAFQVDDIYHYCQKLIDNEITILRPPRDGKMAFIKSPDNISIELLQKGSPLEIKEPWKSMPNQGQW